MSHPSDQADRPDDGAPAAPSSGGGRPAAHPESTPVETGRTGEPGRTRPTGSPSTTIGRSRTGVKAKPDGPTTNESPKNASGTSRNPNLSNFTATPMGVVDTEKLKENRRRSDRMVGIMLLAVGILATITNMVMFTENSLAMTFASFYEQYGVGAYTRPDGLTALSLVGILGHPAIYAIALYLTLIRWRAGKRAAWIPVLGAVLATLFSFALIMLGIMMHPELVQALTAAAQQTPAPTPTP
ncbi:hypothetical protein F8O01_06440 [Pseudoclavibacter chungangensis]|uniref:Uncharacterized protein n=1 Tax=Pseudoclavibacter chungangensis TaxID=587635 RepID=A0A7J5BVN6_9MICO|nr:DUF6264 family protein [Pseudoclavibacter chungangensis]KAB1657913.1 hypothetical protein F8O01_06440 [Pseudoclavibacter chungangensis]NYJ65941.1 hypothetical protein [Pseudoclavibacter chungangensis]